jgi:hypothetical protein
MTFWFLCVPATILLMIVSLGCGPVSETPQLAPKQTDRLSITGQPVASVADATLPTSLKRDLHMRTSRDNDWFAEIAESLGLRFSYRDGNEAGLYELIESVGGGGASFDFDRDGYQDLFLSGGGTLENSHSDGVIAVRGHPPGLFRNFGGDRFSEAALMAGITGQDLYSHGCTVIDFDADGFEDLLLAGFGGMHLWRNQGDGTFAEVTKQQGLQHDSWNVSAAVGDFDRDGLPDLYLLTYADWQPDPRRRCLNDRGLRDICGPTMFKGVSDAVFRNTGSGFEDITQRMGLVPHNRGLGVVVADLDIDGFLDVVVVNDVEENLLYRGTDLGTFRESGLLAGIAYSNSGQREGSMGVDIGDFDGDGSADLWYTNYSQQDNSLLKNVGRSGFLHQADLFGLSGVSRPWVGFGTLLADFNGDGWDDIFITNGHVAYERRDSPYFQPPQLFKNDSGKRFFEATDQGGNYFDLTWSGRGALQMDYNNDGANDVVVVHQNDPVALLRNQHRVANWIRLDLVGTTVERQAIGAVATIVQADRKLHRWKYSGGSYLSHSDARLLFSLHESAPVDVAVTWPGGRVENFVGLQTNMTHVLIEGAAEHVPTNAERYETPGRH